MKCRCGTDFCYVCGGNYPGCSCAGGLLGNNDLLIRLARLRQLSDHNAPRAQPGARQSLSNMPSRRNLRKAASKRKARA